MRKSKEVAGRKCPLFGKIENQVNAGKNRSGTQRCFCKDCKKYYTLDLKTGEYPEEIRNQAIKAYYAGTSGRGVGKMFGFNKANVYNWTKTNGSNSEECNFHILKLDELYWFVGKNQRPKYVRTPM